MSQRLATQRTQTASRNCTYFHRPSSGGFVCFPMTTTTIRGVRFMHLGITCPAERVVDAGVLPH